MDLVAELTDVAGKTWQARDEQLRFNFGAVLAGDEENEVPAAWARLLPGSWAGRFGRDPRYAGLVLFTEPVMAQAGNVSPAGLASWYQRFVRAARLPAVLAGYLTSDLGLATSSDPAAGIAIWLKARGASLTELADVDGFTVVPGARASWFIGLAAADQDGQDPDGLAGPGSRRCATPCTSTATNQSSSRSGPPARREMGRPRRTDRDNATLARSQRNFVNELAVESPGKRTTRREPVLEYYTGGWV